jgi:vancomycin resistance protein YoaR
VVLGGVGAVALSAVVMAFVVYAPQVDRGVTVLGVDLGGHSRAEAARVLRDRLGGRLDDAVAVRVGGVAASVRPADVGLRLDVDATVDRAVRATPGPFAWLAGGRPVGPVVDVDPVRLQAALTPHVGGQGRPVTKPAIRYDGLTPTPVYGEPGFGLDRGRVADALRAGWLRRSAIDVPLTDVTPATGRADLDRLITDLAAPAVAAPVVLTTPAGELNLTPAMIATALKFEADDAGRVVPRVDPEALRTAADGFKKVERAPADAAFVVENGRPVVRPHVDGQGVDLPALAGALLDVLARPAPRSLAAPLTTTAPKITTDQLAALGVKEQVSTFTTRFQAGQPRVTNIKKMADTVRGVVVKPGETFSLNGFVGERTRAKGYVDAPQIVGGKIKNGPGGGVSQFTTTLFNASYYAGLVDVEHRPHSYYFDRYPAVIESTLDFGHIDLRFRNDAPTGIYIHTAYTATSVTVTLFGTKRFDVTTVYGPRTNVVQPKVVYLSEDDCNPTDGLPGFAQEAFRVFKQNGAEVRRERFFWRYDAEPRFICSTPPA